ncbi:hypothetical protein HAX54_037917 [Datura stramonium]|uniref:Pentatricopeptide repeat-containing protein n=1 Tax=Datura stramonium TaxID=4076 RepID=A0ABS8SHB9_DATST|nr:hypothetical protein [Datura stramonium]
MAFSFSSSSFLKCHPWTQSQNSTNPLSFPPPKPISLPFSARHERVASDFSLLQKLGNVGSFDSMRGVLDDMKKLQVELVEGTFFIFIESYAKFELYDEAIRVLDMMWKVFGMKPGTFSYNLLLNVLVDGNKLKLVENVHSRMLDEGVKADVSTFNILIKALCKTHQIRPAILMMEEMPMYGLVRMRLFTAIMQELY